MILHPIIDLLKRIVIALPDYAGGGGDGWELVADYTSDADATVVTAEIPSDDQTANVYKVQISTEFLTTDYPYYGLNDTFSTVYDLAKAPNTPWIFIGYVVKRETNDDSSYTLAIGGKSVSINDSTLESISLKSYYEDKIKTGCNIKVWRLVE